MSKASGTVRIRSSCTMHAHIAIYPIYVCQGRDAAPARFGHVVLHSVSAVPGARDRLTRDPRKAGIHLILAGVADQLRWARLLACLKVEARPPRRCSSMSTCLLKSFGESSTEPSMRNYLYPPLWSERSSIT